MLALKCSLLNWEYVLINALKALISTASMCSFHVIFLSTDILHYLQKGCSVHLM
jgi:hypothetical protein